MTPHAATERGITQAESGANAAHEGFTDEAMTFLRDFAQRYKWFTAFMFVAAAEKRFPDVNSKAFGAVFQRASREKLIRKTGQTLPHPRRHRCPAIIWQSMVAK